MQVRVVAQDIRLAFSSGKADHWSFIFRYLSFLPVPARMGARRVDTFKLIAAQCFRGFFITVDSREIAVKCAQIADQKKAQDIVILDLNKISSVTGYFVICSGINERQLYAIADEIDKQLKDLSVRKYGIEGYREAKWILIDYGDVIVHLFDKEMRNYYDLELLWGDAPRVKW